MIKIEELIQSKMVWVNIDHQLYSKDFYSEFMPSGLIQEEHLYNTYSEAEEGKHSYIFRDYNLKGK